MIKSFAPFVSEGSLVTVEVDLRRGIPAIDIVGFADAGVSALRERIRSATANQGFEFPGERVLISLSPADLRKDEDSFELPVALAVLAQKNGMTEFDDVLVMGSLSLHGETRAVRGLEAALQTAYAWGIRCAIVPPTAGLDIPSGMKVSTVGSLREAYDSLMNLGNPELFSQGKEKDERFRVEFNGVEGESLDEIEGLDGLKYAMAVAVAGRHSILAYGRPGCGKTLVLQKMPQLLPKLTSAEAESVRRIYSVAGLPVPEGGARPFRMPHQTASLEGMCGGGQRCSPGEISLAHNGVLFLDEAAEFKSSVLQMLRVPLGTGAITLSRAGRTTVYPAGFQLAMATNPCPCGNLGNPDRPCLCSRHAIELYWRKLGAPLLSRMAIRFDVNTGNDMEVPHWSLDALRREIRIAWEAQYRRQGKLNQDLNPAEMEKFFRFEPEAKEMLETAAGLPDMQPVELINIRKLAQTVADMNDTANDLFPKSDGFVQKKDVVTALGLFGKLPVRL